MVQVLVVVPQARAQRALDAEVEAAAEAVRLLVETVKLDREGAWQKAQRTEDDDDLPPGVSLQSLRDKNRTMRRGPVFIDAPSIQDYFGRVNGKALVATTRSTVPYQVLEVQSQSAAVVSEQISQERSGYRNSSKIRDNGVYVRLESIQQKGNELVIDVEASWTYLRSSKHSQTATGHWIVRYLFSQQDDVWKLQDEQLILRAQ
jgi:hypothetical protein